MRNFLRDYIFVFCLLLLATVANCQQRPYPRVPVSVRKNSEKLSAWVTQNSTNDSQKVAAIYYWITHNIKYDVKKFLKFDYSVESTQKVLKKRKAICTGYSQLFSDMCNHIGIKSVQVPGYTKSHIERDVCDSFYLDDHIWNAVYVDGSWYLLDATWDAGYLLTSHVTFWSFTRHYLSLKRRWKYTPCFKFIRRPSTNYYIKSGNYFLYDHLPANPLWQLTENKVSTFDFQNDSSHYHFMKPDNKNIGNYINFSRDAYASLSRDKQMIEDGIAATEFNPKNQFGAALSSFILTNNYINDLNIKIENRDILGAQKLLDSIEKQANKTIWYCDSNVSLLKEEQNILCNHVRTKNSLLQSQNRQLKSNSKRTITFKNKLKTQKKSFNKFYNTSLKTASKRLITMSKDAGIYKSYPAKKRMYADSLLLRIEMKSVDSLIVLSLNELKQNQQKVQDFSIYIQQKVDTHMNFCYDKQSLCWQSYIARANGFDNYDYVIHDLKDTLVVEDTIRALDFKINNKHILDSVMSLYRQTRVQASAIVGLYSKRGSIFKRLKTKSVEGWQDIMKQYENNLMTANNFSVTYYNWLKSNKRLYDYISKPTLTFTRSAKRTVKTITYENEYKQSTSKIMKKQRSLIKVSDHYKKKAQQQIKEVEKIRKKLGKV